MTTNKDRARRAGLALLAHQLDDSRGNKTQARLEVMSGRADVVSWLLADLRHFCDAHGLDFGELDKKGYRCYTADKVDERMKGRK